MAIDPAGFWLDPIGNILAAFTSTLGVWFYGWLVSIVGGYTLIKTESWEAASGILILCSLVFSALLPPYIIFIWSFAVALVFAFVLVDVFVLK